MNKRLLTVILAACMLLAMLSGCASTDTGAAAQPVTLRVVGAWEDFRALEAVASGFTKENPGCTIEYEYLQDYYASLETRLAGDEDVIDLFITSNIQADSALLPYALDLYSRADLDLSKTFDGLITNFEFRGAEDGNSHLYAVPVGAEIRGMFVNKTLLGSLGLEVPTTAQQLLDACQVLLDAGYIPLQGNPGSFGQQLMYPYCCNLIANSGDTSAYDLVAFRGEGVGEIFRQPMDLLYSIVEKGYYNYKYIETEFNRFTDASAEGYSRDFLNIVAEGDGYAKADDVGCVAFMPSSSSVESTLEKMKNDYHSEIEYEFIMSPVGEDGGYAYMSPAHGIAVNKNSPNVDMAVKFLNYLFTPATNEAFSDAHHVVPNTENAFSIIASQFDVPENHICELGQVTFDYDFYASIVGSLTEVAKSNNPKYMQEDGSMYDFEHYMENLEKRLMGTMEEG